jgi:hypothetical protein
MHCVYIRVSYKSLIHLAGRVWCCSRLIRVSEILRSLAELTKPIVWHITNITSARLKQMVENSCCYHYQEDVQIRPQFHCCWREEIKMLNTRWRSGKTPCSGFQEFQVLVFNSVLFTRSWDSAVGIVNGCRLDDRGFKVQAPVGSRIFSMSSRPVLGATQTPIESVLGALFLG